VAELTAAGAKRISTGSALNRAALGAFLRAGRELKESGTMSFIPQAIPYAEIMKMMPDRPSK
jgi:2-methylisocitrate lyase-like PEP mutase family enzyme